MVEYEIIDLGCVPVFALVSCSVGLAKTLAFNYSDTMQTVQDASEDPDSVFEHPAHQCTCCPRRHFPEFNIYNRFNLSTTQKSSLRTETVRDSSRVNHAVYYTVQVRLYKSSLNISICPMAAVI